MWGLVFLFGLSIGSFLNVVVYRVIHGDSPLRGRSECPYCHKQISWHDNIPLLSFMLLRGKCRYCRKKISWRYPTLELLTGAVFVWWWGMGQIFFRLTQDPYTTIQPIFWLMVGVGLVSLLVADLFYGLLPDIFTWPLVIMAMVYRLGLTVSGIMQVKDFWGAMGAGVGAAGFFAGLIWITRGKGMGWGDVKLALFMGLLLGWPRIVVALFTAFLTGAAVGIILVVTGKKGMKQTIPFGPFLILGTLIALLWGENIVATYFNLALR